MAFRSIRLLGDATFAPRFHITVGTARAAKDAWKFSKAVGKCGGDVVSALMEYEEKQVTPVYFCVNRAKELSNRMQGIEDK